MVYEGIHIPEQDPWGTNFAPDTASQDLAQGQDWIRGGKAMAFSAAGMAAISEYFTQDMLRLQGKREATKAAFAGYAFDQQVLDSVTEAHLITEAGKLQESYLGMAVNSQKAQQRVNAARRGVLASSGSSAEVRASMEISRQLDARTININTARQASAARMQAVRARASASAAHLSAKHLRRTGKGIAPHLVALTSAARSVVGSSLSLTKGK